MFNWRDLFKMKSPKIFEAMQIEISSICNLKCKFCPTAYISDKGKINLMSLQTFQKLQPYFSEAKWVYLQGWGEPLLNQDIWKMTKLVKEAGSKVGFTTNGTLLSSQVINNLISHQVDLVSISIAGATGSVHEKLRVNSNLQNIIGNIECLVREKKDRQSSFPLISISYMLTKESIAELPSTVESAYKLGVNDFYTTNLDYVFSEETNENKVFVWVGKPLEEYENYLKEAQKFAQSKNFSFRTYPLSPEEEMAVCDLNPAKLVFITSNGDVTPCTYLGRKVNPRYYHDEITYWPRKVFGNINTEDFSEIWHKTAYQEFRNKFVLRRKAYEDLILSYSGGGLSLPKIKKAENDYYRLIKENPLPEECRSCPKKFGI